MKKVKSGRNNINNFKRILWIVVARYKSGALKLIRLILTYKHF